MGSLPKPEIPFDRPSVKFTNRWLCIGDIYLPTIFRLGFDPIYQHPSIHDPPPSDKVRFTRYAPLRLIKQRVLPKYTHAFKQRLFDMLKTPAYNMTQVEADVFNYMQETICSELFGTQPFTTKDYLLLIQDAMRVVEFLNFLATRAIRSPSEVHPNFGFVHFGDNVLYPYYTIEGITFLPSAMCKGAVDPSKEYVLPLMIEKMMRVLMYLQNKRIFFGRMKFLTVKDFHGGVKVEIYEQWIADCQNRFLMPKLALQRFGSSVFKITVISNDVADYLLK